MCNYSAEELINKIENKNISEKDLLKYTTEDQQIFIKDYIKIKRNNLIEKNTKSLFFFTLFATILINSIIISVTILFNSIILYNEKSIIILVIIIIIMLILSRIIFVSGVYISKFKNRDEKILIALISYKFNENLIGD